MKKHTLFACLLFIGTGLGMTATAQTDLFVSKEPQNRAVLLEEYTGVRCSNCPDGHRIANNLAEKYPNRFYAVNIHTSSFAEPYGSGEPDFRTSYGEDLAENAGVNSLPSAAINRHVFQGEDQALGRLLWEGYTEACLEMPAYANIAGKAAFDWQTRELSVEVQVFFTDNVPVAANRIHVVLLQNDIIGSQKNAANNPAQNLGNNLYRHMHVFRDFITDEWGDEIAGAEGGFISRTYSKRLPERIRNIELRPDDLSVVVFVSEDRNEVINAAEAPILMQNGPGHLFAYRNGHQVTQRSCDNDIRIGFTLENRTYKGEPVREIGFRVQTTGSEAEAAAFTVNVADGFGYEDGIDIVSDPFPLPRVNETDTVNVYIETVNGKPYGYDGQKTLRIPVAKHTAYTAESVVEVHIWQDMFGSETQWTFQDEAGTVLAAEGPYDDLTAIGVKEHTKAVTLHEGCHTFKITDANGDGINNLFGKGHFSLNTPDGAVLAENDGRFGDSAFVFIKKTGVANERPADGSVEVVLTPNPARDALRITCRHEIREVRIFNLCGKEMRPAAEGLGGSDYRCAVNGFAPGIYFVRVSTAGGTAISKFVVR
ncbi:MAG: Omp28-related outer membrane protein [Bacteroidales bacterium]|nr:Omp28-related outer membrane protein [Bacteroidales bacterium]